jgi:hypothetical protein
MTIDNRPRAASYEDLIEAAKQDVNEHLSVFREAARNFVSSIQVEEKGEKNDS